MDMALGVMVGGSVDTVVGVAIAAAEQATDVNHRLHQRIKYFRYQR